MCKLSSITIVSSTLPILTWVLLYFSQGDNQLTSIFSATYSMQLLSYTLMAIFVSGNLIRKARNIGTTNEVNSGIALATTIAIILAVVMCLNIEAWVSYMSLDVKYTKWALYSICYLSMLVPITQIIEVKYFENNVKAGFKFTFNTVKGCKYCYTSLVNNGLMFVTFFFGMKAVFNYGAEFALDVSVMAMATDVQWDMMGNSIFTLSKTEIANGKADMKKLQSSSQAFVLSMAGRSLVIALVIHGIYNINTEFMLVILAFELIDMLTIQKRYVKQTWLDIEFGGKQLIVVALALKVVSMVVSLCAPSQYALWIGQIASGVLGWAYYKYTYYRCNKLGIRRDTKILEV